MHPPESTPGPRSFLPLPPMDFYVLLALDGGPRHGYGIMKAVEDTSGGDFHPEIGSLYRMISRMASSGLIEETEAPSSEGDGRGRPRRYYRMTDLGEQVARAEAMRLRSVLRVARDHDLVPAPEEP